MPTQVDELKLDSFDWWGIRHDQGLVYGFIFEYIMVFLSGIWNIFDEMEAKKKKNHSGQGDFYTRRPCAQLIFRL